MCSTRLIFKQQTFLLTLSLVRGVAGTVQQALMLCRQQIRCVQHSEINYPLFHGFNRKQLSEFQMITGKTYVQTTQATRLACVA